MTRTDWRGLYQVDAQREGDGRGGAADQDEGGMAGSPAAAAAALEVTPPRQAL